MDLALSVRVPLPPHCKFNSLAEVVFPLVVAVVCCFSALTPRQLCTPVIIFLSILFVCLIFAVTCCCYSIYSSGTRRSGVYLPTK